jgi:hypothetical protein
MCIESFDKTFLRPFFQDQRGGMNFKPPLNRVLKKNYQHVSVIGNKKAELHFCHLDDVSIASPAIIFGVQA